MNFQKSPDLVTPVSVDLLSSNSDFAKLESI